jgi:tetratricopeptide (TPR) repeat protein
VERLARPTGSETTIDDLMEAVATCQGDLLPGFDEEWILLEREQLRAIYEDRLQRLLKALAAEQHWRAAVQWAERWIAQGGSPEPAYRALMAAHAALGDRSAVAAAYQRCVQALEIDLSAPPSTEMIALYNAIRDGQGAQGEQQEASHPAIPSPFHNLPPQTTLLVGAKPNWQRWPACLQSPGAASDDPGRGGMGKTRLAQALHVPPPEAFYPRAAALPILALLLAERGDVERALEAYALATRVPCIATPTGSTMWLDATWRRSRRPCRCRSLPRRWNGGRH